MILQTDDELRALLAGARRIAVVGASDNPARPSNGVFRYLRDQANLSPSPVNPSIQALDGAIAYPTLQAYAGACGAPDIVDVFRKADDAAGVAQEAIDVRAKAIWFQLGVVNPRAIALADEAGLDVVVDRCIKIELQRLFRGS
ncbi:MAG: CoA-binding protein [Candidatus Eremiobacteraeota bacterium]|nr:CoA-binding protein [Candidatus Eremiobacteraeota bacterium]